MRQIWLLVLDYLTHECGYDYDAQCGYEHKECIPQSHDYDP